MGIAGGDAINRVNLLYVVDVGRSHRIDRTRQRVRSILIRASRKRQHISAVERDSGLGSHFAQRSSISVDSAEGPFPANFAGSGPSSGMSGRWP